MKATRAEPATQHAALCYRRIGSEWEILLVTSRDTGRWVLPKGWPKKGEDGGASALREAGEEAGVTGKVIPGPAQQYFYDKVMPSGPALACAVSLHVIEVAHLAYDFPEKTARRRMWFSPFAAAAAVDEPCLKAILAGFQPPPAGRVAQ